MDKEAREAAALAARAAARAKLAAAGQVLPSAPGASAPPPAPSSFLAMDPSRKLLAVRTAFSLAGAVGVGGGGGGGGGTHGPSDTSLGTALKDRARSANRSTFHP